MFCCDNYEKSTSLKMSLKGVSDIKKIIGSQVSIGRSYKKWVFCYLHLIWPKLWQKWINMLIIFINLKATYFGRKSNFGIKMGLFRAKSLISMTRRSHLWLSFILMSFIWFRSWCVCVGGWGVTALVCKLIGMQRKINYIFRDYSMILGLLVSLWRESVNQSLFPTGFIFY